MGRNRGVSGALCEHPESTPPDVSLTPTQLGINAERGLCLPPKVGPPPRGLHSCGAKKTCDSRKDRSLDSSGVLLWSNFICLTRTLPRPTKTAEFYFASRR
jgi:hypothetical protein